MLAVSGVETTSVNRAWSISCSCLISIVFLPADHPVQKWPSPRTTPVTTSVSGTSAEEAEQLSRVHVFAWSQTKARARARYTEAALWITSFFFVLFLQQLVKPTEMASRGPSLIATSHWRGYVEVAFFCRSCFGTLKRRLRNISVMPCEANVLNKLYSK